MDQVLFLMLVTGVVVLLCGGLAFCVLLIYTYYPSRDSLPHWLRQIYPRLKLVGSWLTSVGIGLVVLAYVLAHL